MHFTFPPVSILFLSDGALFAAEPLQPSIMGRHERRVKGVRRFDYLRRLRKAMRLMAFAGFLSLIAPRSFAEESSEPKPTAKPPNILLILADDLGFSDLGCYGSDIHTPNLDALAKNGLRFTQFYNTARCWPTRGALLTGYYPQQMQMDPPTGHVPSWTHLLPQWLTPLGYRSYHSGKWHIQGVDKSVADGGFDHSYRLDDPNHNFNPSRLLEDDKRLPPVSKDSGYYTSTADADAMIRYLKEHAEKYPNQPFFAYLAFTVPHFPLQAPAEDIAKYRDHYIKGWDQEREERWKRLTEMGIINCALSPQETDITAPGIQPRFLKELGPGEIDHTVPWDQLTDEQKRFQAEKMAIHAAMIDRMDQEIGRVLDQVRAMGGWDNTLILFLSDNGASAEMIVRGDGNDPTAAPGSAGSFLCLGPGWANAANTPFRRYKIWTHEGGVSTPLIVHWPDGIAAQGELRHDVGHVVDIVPTVLDLAGAKPEMPPDEPPFPGVSLVPAFAKDGAVTRDYVFFNHQGNRALRVGDYKLIAPKEDGGNWHLYNLANDRGEQHDLAAEQPERVQDMTARWEKLESSFVREAGPVPPDARKKSKKDKAAAKSGGED